MKMSEPQLNDPWFYDDSDFIKCNSCDDTFDHNLYNSKTCLKCEDKQVERERANANANRV